MTHVVGAAIPRPGNISARATGPRGSLRPGKVGVPGGKVIPGRVLPPSLLPPAESPKSLPGPRNREIGQLLGSGTQPRAAPPFIALDVLRRDITAGSVFVLREPRPDHWATADQLPNFQTGPMPTPRA